jgi:AcrR family transcriptional regulator
MAAEAPDLSRPKAQKILDGAREVFLELGYEGASVDEIVRRAGVSKGTLYNYFADKRALFSAVIDRECSAQAAQMIPVNLEADDVEAALLAVARTIVHFVTSPFAQKIFRIVVAEAERFPDIGRTFYESGPRLGVSRLAQLMAAAHATGRLRVPDAELAAHQFIELCRADLFYQLIFGIKQAASEAEIERIAQAAVRTFVEAHRPRGLHVT